MYASFRVIWRFFYFLIITLRCFAFFFLLLLTRKPKEAAALAIKKKWLARVPHRLGLRMTVEGTPYSGTCLYVANHISYIDPIVIFMHADARVVAKAEVSRWPVVGYGAYIVGTIFVQRDEKDSRRATVEAIRDALSAGTSILVFPEGTTSAGPGTLPFRPRSFEAAAAAGVPVQPVAILYDSRLAAFIGRDTFLPHFFRLFRLQQITGRVAFGPVLHGDTASGEARSWIEKVQHEHFITRVEHEPA